MVVPQVGRVAETGDEWLPYELLDPEGIPVMVVSEFFRDLLAAGRSASTTRSYGMDLLRWFRFLWAIGGELGSGDAGGGPGFLPVSAGGW